LELDVTFPQVEIGSDPGAIRAYAQAVEALGFTRLVALDHVLGADTRNRPDWTGPYTSKDMVHEPLVLLSYLAAVTTRLQLVTAILILPQRQTALVAKQAAEIDVLSGGRLTLGVGLGWNLVEFQALGENFHNRGRRMEEQIEVLRALWTQEAVTFHGRWHHISGAGINPLPVQRPIPIWFGAQTDVAFQRAARLGDGLILLRAPRQEWAALAERLRGYARAAGREASSLGLEITVNLADTPQDQWATAWTHWQAAGGTHLRVGTVGCGFTSVDQHIEALRHFREALS